MALPVAIHISHQWYYSMVEYILDWWAFIHAALLYYRSWEGCSKNSKNVDGEHGQVSTIVVFECQYSPVSLLVRGNTTQTLQKHYTHTIFT